MKTKGIYYYVLQEHFDKITAQSNLNHQILFELLSRFVSNTHDANGFVRVSSRTIQGIVHEYKQYLSFLVTNNMIFIDNEYEEGGKTKGYKLREEKHSRVLKIEVKEHKFVKEKIKYFNSRKNLFKRKAKLERFNHLKTSFKDFIKGIDIKNAIEDIQSIGNANDRVNQYKLLDKIKENKLYFKRNKNNGRLDHSLTNIKSAIKFYNKENYISIDISNSQPFFLIELLLGYTTNYHNVSKYPCNIYDNETVKVVQKCVNDMKKIPTEELNKFRDWVCTGKLYDNFIAKEFIDGTDEFEDERNKVKKMMYCIFFSKVNSYQYEKKRFAFYFPEILNYVNNFKTTNHDGGKKGHNVLALWLQSIEAYRVLDVICEDLYKNNISVVTIHDSFIVKEEDFEKAFEIIKSHFPIIQPNFKFEVFDEVRESKKLKMKAKLAPKTKDIEENVIEHNHKEKKCHMPLRAINMILEREMKNETNILFNRYKYITTI